MEKEQEFLVSSREAGARLDKFLAGKALSLTRSQVQKLVREGKVSVNGELSQCSCRVKDGDKVIILCSSLKSPKILPENIPLSILYEDKELLVIDKPAGMVVHPAPGHASGTLVNALLFHTQTLSRLNGPLRPGIVHRLDKDTSGALLVAKTDAAHRYLAGELKKRKLTRKYLALVEGEIKLEEGTVGEIPLGRHLVKRKKMAVRYQGGKEAITSYRVLERFAEVTFLEITLATGRTHQIRVHLAHLGHPVVGDKTYGGKLSLLARRQCLHAYALGFIHPVSGKYLEFTAPLPEDMNKLLQRLKKEAFEE